MADTITVAATPRQVEGKKVKQLRRAGVIPANLFGRGRDSRAIQVAATEIKRILAKHAGSKILRLAVGGTEDTVLIRHIQREPKTGAIQHIDFMHVDMKERMHAKVPVSLVGEAPGVKLYNGVLLLVLDSVDVECLPGNLPEVVEADVSGLAELDSALHVRDLTVPDGVEILSEGDEIVAKVERTRAAVEEAPAATPAAAAEAPAEAGAAKE
ncbi:MAG TPA: 50S ribosomal protein L25 [Ktedonobacterales bacterium]|jgi:large subunit ribosomal protein L25|nr:50S ribosomal protein L25 [Ktedonobacterales bacterium]